jgi:hypothetical protein
MTKILRLVGLIALVAAGAVHAVPILVTTPGALAANDSVNWGQLGSDGSTINPAFLATSVGGLPIAGSMASDGCLAVVGGSVCSWAPNPPGFNIPDFVIWTENSNGGGSGPLSLSFPSVFGAGLWIQANAPGRFTAQIQVFLISGASFSFSEVSDAAGDGLFIGAKDTVSDIAKIVLSLTSCTAGPGGCDLGDFAVNSLLLRTTAPTVPEPTSLSLLLLGGAGLAFFRRSRRASLTVAKEEKKV